MQLLDAKKKKWKKNIFLLFKAISVSRTVSRTIERVKEAARCALIGGRTFSSSEGYIGCSTLEAFFL